MTLEHWGNYTATVRLYPGVKGGDAGLVDAGWASVGGAGPVPCLDSAWVGVVTRVETEHRPKDTYFVFGTVSVQVMSKSTVTTPTNWVWIGSWDTLDDSKGITPVVSSVIPDEQDYCGSGTGIVVSIPPDLEVGSVWGPIPIVIALVGYYAPGRPEGNPDALKHYHFALDPGNVNSTTLPGPSSKNTPS